MSGFRMVVLGDSVTWGQGLRTAEKFYSLVKVTLTGTNGDEGCIVLAHSGATIGVGVTTTEPDVDGEVPTSYPTVMQQCAAFDDSPESVDLVILNGGINDVDFRLILNPFTDQSDLQDMIVQYCYKDVKRLLENVGDKFSKPAARIVLTSYFPVLSDQSFAPMMHVFLALHGVTGTPSPFFPLHRNQILDKVLAHCDQFWTQSNIMFQRAVDEVNGAAGGTPRVRFARPPFTAANSALAADAWLWGIRPDLSPEDPIAGDRHVSCNLFEHDLLQREICFRASAGHPNVIGSRKFADAILAVL